MLPRALMFLAFFAVTASASGAESATLQDMLGAHMDRVMRKSGILLPTRHGEPTTNWFGRVVMEGADALPSGYNYIQLRDNDGWAEIRDESGALTREVAPIREDAAFVLGDLFGFLPSEDTPPELRLSHLVSKWLVCHSQEESAAIDLTDDEWRVLQARIARSGNLRSRRLAEAPPVVTNLMTTAIAVSGDDIDLLVEWPSWMSLPYDFLDLYSSVDLRNWTRYDRYDVNTCPNQMEVRVSKTSIPGFLEHLPAQHESTCHIVTNVSASAFQPGVVYTNRHWNCAHKPRGETPGFFRWRALEEVGFSEQWIRDNYPDDAETILARGYEQWVDDQIGYDLTNGYYKLNAYVYGNNWTFQDPKMIRVGNQEIRVFLPGMYSFLLEKGLEYEIETTFGTDEISFSAQDDLADRPVFADVGWDGLFCRGLWSETGGECAIRNAYSGVNGFCCWLPRLRGAPDIDHLSENRTLTFTAELSDYRASENATFRWTCDDPNIRIVSPDAQTTDIEFLTFPSWREATISVQVLDITYYNVFASSLRFTYGENLSPQAHLSMNIPEGLPTYGERIPMTVSFTSDIQTNGVITVECITGAERVNIFGSENAENPISGSIGWTVDRDSEKTFYLQGKDTSSYQEIEIEGKFIPEHGEQVVVSGYTTVFDCGVQPITTVVDLDGIAVNPSFVAAQSTAAFHTDVYYTEIPASKICWRKMSGEAEFVTSPNGKDVSIRAISGTIDLAVEILGYSNKRMHLKTIVIEQE